MSAKEALLRVDSHIPEHGSQPTSAGLINAVTRFLDTFGEASLLGREFAELIGGGDGQTRFAGLLAACGYEGDAEGFFAELLDKLAKADGAGNIAVGGLNLPHLLLMAVMETILPGKKFISVKTVEQLEELTNVKVPDKNRAAMQEVIETYPVRLSMHTIRQMRVSRDVAYQYLPFIEELDSVGHINTWIGQFHQGLLEQMYQNRVIFLLNMSCPVYCRFCFRKHKESRNETNPTVTDVQNAVLHVKSSPSIKEIVVTGGDPFLNRSNMAAAIDGLMEIEHVQTLRLATRSVAYYPELFLAKNGELLNYLKTKNLELERRGKRLELATHFIHPDEISPQSLKIITELVRNGIPVYVQTPFLNDCNDKGPELVRLFSLLRGAGAELHYIYIPCSPIHGNSVYWSPISKGLEAGGYLRAHLSDRVIPRICTATPIGKMDWHTSGWAVEPVKGRDSFIWIRTPYTPGYFKEFAPLANKLDNIRVNHEGTIDVQYMAKIGDESLFLGARPPRPDAAPAPPGAENADEVNHLIQAEEVISQSIVPTGRELVSRVHETRVEVGVGCGEEEMAYIRGDDRITDVVIIPRVDAVDSLRPIARIIRALEDIPHVNAVRLRSRKFNHEPEAYTAVVIDTLGRFNRLSMVNPLRLEIETRFIWASEITAEHARLTRELGKRGVTVYCNTPLLGRVNDSADAIHSLAYACRGAGIEFHHLYLAGLPVQDKWNRKNPVWLYDVIDIAAKVRREGSGREVPRYILRTVLGEVDFGLCSKILGRGEDLFLKMLPYDISYYTSMAPGFVWPEGVTEDDDGCPLVPLNGLVKATDFALC